jgi:phosphoglucosamine mutase
MSHDSDPVPDLFGTSGIRGPVGEVVTADLALRVGRAVGVDAGKVLLGRDARTTGPVLADAFAAGAREAGADVLDAGVAATPTVARAVGWFDADVGCVVTASHNPPADNGLKLWTPSGAFDADRRAVVERRVAEGVDPLGWERQGDRRSVDARSRHVEALAGDVGIEDPPRVAVDLGNGAGGVTVDALGALGCEVETLNAQPDGRFPARPSEPTAKHCGSLCALVAGTDADLGIAHDGDADRMMAVTADGTFVPGDALLAVLGAAVADEGERVALPVDTSLAVADHLADHGIGVERTPVGDVHVAAALGGSVTFGGEPSGAWIWPSVGCPDGPLAACRLAALAADRPLGDRLAAVPDYPIRRTSIEVPDKAARMERVREAVASRYDPGAVETLDGVRVDLGDAWFLVRASGTQPLVRVTAEARDADRAESAFREATGLVRSGE